MKLYAIEIYKKRKPVGGLESRYIVMAPDKEKAVDMVLSRIGTDYFGTKYKDLSVTEITDGITCETNLESRRR